MILSARLSSAEYVVKSIAREIYSITNTWWQFHSYMRTGKAITIAILFCSVLLAAISIWIQYTMCPINRGQNDIMAAWNSLSMMYGLKLRTIYAPMRMLFFYIIFPCCQAMMNVNARLTPFEWSYEQSATRIHTLFYCLHNMISPQLVSKKATFTHRIHIWLILCMFQW